MNTNSVTHSIGLALVMIALSAALAFAGRAHLIDGDLPTRISMALSGLIIAFYGNAIPKALLRSARSRSARRFAGWAFTLSGLITTALWALAPVDTALTLTLVVVGAAVVLAFAVCILSRDAT